MMHRWTMSAAVGLVSCAVVAPTQGSLILNGSFEDNLAGDSTLYNLSNDQFTDFVAFATGFGTADEIDLMVVGSSYGAPPVDGDYKVGIATNNVGEFDAFSFSLSSPIIAGVEYDLSFWAESFDHSTYTLAVLSFGVSDSATEFGTLVHTTDQIGVDGWQFMATAFTASAGGQFLTIRVDLPGEGESARSWAFIDAFSLTAVPGPATLASLMAVSLMMGGRRRRTWPLVTSRR